MNNNQQIGRMISVKLIISSSNTMLKRVKVSYTLKVKVDKKVVKFIPLLRVVNVDDLTITGMTLRAFYFIHSQFYTMYLETSKYFFGIEVSKSKQGIF